MGWVNPSRAPRLLDEFIISNNDLIVFYIGVLRISGDYVCLKLENV